MTEISPIIAYGLIALITLALYALAWRGSRGGTVFETVVVRLGLAVLVVVPVVAAALFAAFGTFRPEVAVNKIPRPTASAPPASAPASPAPPSQPRAMRRRVDEQHNAPQSAPPPAAPSATTSPAPPAPPSPPVVGRPEPKAADSAPPAPAAAPTTTAEATAPAASPEPGGGAGATGPADQPVAPPATPPPAAPLGRSITPSPAAVERKWDVVPVYYGTDRARSDDAKRAVYGSERGRRLELGRALVTVPKAHEVPTVERPWVYKLPFTSIVLYREKEDPDRHFTLQEVKALSRADLIALIRERLAASKDFKNHAFVFVHGFNNTFDAALFRTAQIAYDLQFDGAPFLYSWPSKGVLGVSDYSYDRESSGQAQPYLKEFLELVVSETGATSVSVIAHSMGNQLLMSVLRDLKRSKPDGVVVSQVILAAPDVDRDTFAFLASEIKGVGRGITMLAASNDRALDISRRFWGGVARAGDIPAEGPVLIAGIDTIDVTAVSTDVLAINHSGYAEKTTLLKDMRLLLRTGERPPEKRVPTLERVTTSRGDYWRYPKATP